MSQTTATFADRFWVKVSKTETCWVWNAAKDTTGYGRIKQGRRLVPAHRVAYELLVGPIPDGAELDHLCRNHACVNPAHLEPVDHRTNCLRGTGTAARWARQTHCIRGHELSGDNVFRRKDKPMARGCRECRRIRLRAWLKQQAKSR